MAWITEEEYQAERRIGMSEKKNTKFVTGDILKSSILGSFQKLDPRYMIKNPVMFVVESGGYVWYGEGVCR